MSGQLLQRARQLRDHRRYEDALAAIHLYLSLDPDSFPAHYELAVTRLLEGSDRTKALADIDRAIALLPDHPGAHAMRSMILRELDRAKEALAAADEARRLDPEMAFAWFCRGNALLALRQLAGAEEAARKALELDADLMDASNLLATVLRLQKRFGEAEVEIERHLERDPENAWTFSTAGWTALNRGQRDKAEQLFREALRLDPVLEQARIGLREAYKARSPFYRLFLSWVFFLQRHSEKNQWLILLGIFIAFRFGKALLSAIHPLAAVPLVVAYLLFAFGGWLANGLGHCLLLKDPLARLSLNRQEKLDGLLVGGLFFGGLPLLVLGVTVLPAGLAFLGGAMMAAAVPGSLVCGNPSAKGRVLFALITAAVVTCGTVICIHGFRKAAGEPLLNDTTGPLFTLGLLAVAITTWIGAIPALRRERPR
jgi:tetratricopeptide (TPR) repeat protein